MIVVTVVYTNALSRFSTKPSLLFSYVLPFILYSVRTHLWNTRRNKTEALINPTRLAFNDTVLRLIQIAEAADLLDGVTFSTRMDRFS